MARPTKCRRVCRMPAARCFAPDIAGAGQVALTLDELECIRLLDWEGMTQEQCALQMQVARATVAGIYQRARRKLADALVHGRALRITGGQHQMVTVQESPLEEKKRLLKQAIEKQDFEQAAVLRDEIKEMESHD